MSGKVVDLGTRRRTREAKVIPPLPIDISYAGFCVINLPHKDNHAPGEPWSAHYGNWRLRVEPGRDLQDNLLSVPCGLYARLILIYLQTQARRYKSPEVSLGDSLHQWLENLGVKAGGNTYAKIGEQIDRINSCKLTFIYGDNHKGAFESDVLVRKGIKFNAPVLNHETGELLANKVVLGDKFFKDLMEHPVPLKHEAIRAIGRNTQALDAYMWLCYRLHSLSESTFVPWEHLYRQFGAGYSELKGFKLHFKKTLAIALAQYPEAQGNVIFDKDPGGVMLKPSAPAIPKTEVDKLMV